MKALFLIFSLFFAQTIFAQQLHLCFKSSDSAYAEDPLQLSFNVIDKDWANGYVQYKGQKGGLLLTFGIEKIIEKSNEGVPTQIEYSFNELTNGKVTGKYFISIVDTKVIYFYYYDKRRKTKINFEQDFSSGEKCGCNW